MNDTEAMVKIDVVTYPEEQRLHILYVNSHCCLTRGEVSIELATVVCDSITFKR